MTLPLIQKYQSFLPIDDIKHIVSLEEGNTPCVRLEKIMRLYQDQYEIYAKVEGFNPTGSFKDRGMTVAISQAKAKGAKAVICASTGNTSASAAAYAAKANMKAFVLIPEGKIAQGKLAQAMVYGAELIQIQGNFDDGMALVKEISQRLPIALVNSVNPNRLAGQKTAAFEVIEVLKRAPDYHVLPVGNAGNISAYWMGYEEFYNLQKIDRKPRMLGYQSSGAAPFVHQHIVEHPETIATAIRIGNPQSWDLANHAVTASKGWFAALTDEDILAAQQLLAQTEGIFCEPASAISIAGLMHDIQQDRIGKGSTIVCTLTGSGLKDPESVLRYHQTAMTRLQPKSQLLYEHLENKLLENKLHT